MAKSVLLLGGSGPQTVYECVQKICNSIYERKLKNVIGQMVCLFLLAERIELNGRFKGPIERLSNFAPCFKNDCILP